MNSQKNPPKQVPQLVLNRNEKDQVFADNSAQVTDFVFDQKVAKVFDDMVSRSVPYYAEMQRMTGELARDFAKPNTNLYDIGCSTATTMILLDEVVDKSVKFVGLDNSQEMLDKAKDKMAQAGFDRQYELNVTDLNQPFSIENASVATLLLTLQFVRPLYRERVVQSLYDGLNQDGALILIEKVTSEDTIFNRLFINNYYDFKKRNGYTETEISQKREALENVLIPYRMDENFELLRKVGFKQIEVFFRWYNFCAIIAVK
jgi:tRNA (cmo5U34)-methyltransferase